MHVVVFLVHFLTGLYPAAQKRPGCQKVSPILYSYLWCKERRRVQYQCMEHVTELNLFMPSWHLFFHDFVSRCGFGCWIWPSFSDLVSWTATFLRCKFVEGLLKNLGFRENILICLCVWSWPPLLVNFWIHPCLLCFMVASSHSFDFTWLKSFSASLAWLQCFALVPRCLQFT